MCYTSLSRNIASELAKLANAIVRIGKRVLHDRKKIDTWIDEQAQEGYDDMQAGRVRDATSAFAEFRKRH